MVLARKEMSIMMMVKCLFKVKCAYAYIFVVVLLVFSFIGSSNADDEFSLERMYNYLKSGDNRLVRYNLPSKDAKQRQQNACGKDLHQILPMFTSENLSVEEKNKAAFLLTSCTIENPKNRSRIGTYNDGLALKTLISMLDVKSGNQKIIDGAALAAEAIWILSFDNANNHQFFLSHDAIPSLSDLIQYENVNLSPHIAKMWASAAIQNLAASYCKTGTGHCWWEYGKDGLFLHPESPLRDELGNTAREVIFENSGLISYLKEVVCKGPISSEPWPSEATNTMGIESDQIMTWAVAGAIKNLALSENANEIFDDIHDCLCDLFYSEDWLESSKAEDALIRLGQKGSCPQPYYKNCHDFDDWRNDLGETCIMYAQNNWCEEYGQLRSKEGISANEACCCCSGGHKTDEDDNEEL